MPEVDPNADPNAQMIDPVLGDEDMTAFLAQLEEGFEYAPNIDLSTFQPQGHTEEEDDPNATDDDDDDDETPNGEVTPTPNEDVVKIGDREFARADVERLMEFDKFLRDNPDKAQRVATALAEQPVVSTTQTTPDPVAFEAPTPPDDVDLDDPNTKFLWDQVVESRKQTWEIQQAQVARDQQYQSDQQAVSQRRAQEDMGIALDQFTKQFPHLNEDDMKVIRDEAGPLVAGMMQHNPPVEALRRSMEVAAWANADIRPKLTDPAKPNPSNAAKSRTRKNRLGAISGTPRSAPKVDSRPTYSNDREMVQGFADALAEAGQGR